VELKRVFADEERVVVTRPQSVAQAFPGHRPDLLVLDVPCSNTGVLARRPEARYRFGRRSLESLVELQRQIMRAAMSLAASGGRVLYSTCSMLDEENQQQAVWLAKQWRGRIVAEHLELPSGIGPAYHDGGYFALLHF
jgi:16S rRNA (cytosine967-C5)-methyltransferase